MEVNCPHCDARFEEATNWTICPHRARPRPTQPGLACAGTARPSLPVNIFAEDFGLIIRTPRRLRVSRGRIEVLS
jgi:hypothetical protein